MNFKLIVFTGICLLVGYCQGAETPSDETSTTNLPTETTASSTTSSTTTTTTNSTTAPAVDFSSWLFSALAPIPPQSKTWVVVDKTTNETCILAQITSQFILSYPVEIKANANITSGNTIIIVPLDNSTESTGLCTNKSHSITLKWDENSVEIDFQLDEDKNFFVTLNLTGQQNCSGKETVLTYNNDATLFKTQADMSYGKVQALIMTVVSGHSSAILSISHIKFQFYKIKKDNLSGPGLVLRPMPPDTNVERNLLWFNHSDQQSVQFWTNQLDEFLEEYRKLPRSENVQQCDYDRPPQPGKVCDVNIRQLYPCITENKYHYHRGGPCIFLTFNKIYGWKPIMYNDTTKLPDKMPQHFKGLIELAKRKNSKAVNTVWVTCEGENPADVENMGPINYLPSFGFEKYFIPYLGFEEYFFPYLNQEGYLSPLLALFFERPATGVRINIVCKAWAHNIDNDGLQSPGSVHFALRVD